MSYEPFLIAPFTTGLDTDVAPWLAPSDAFTTLENAYLYHGVVHKRNGVQFFVQFEDNVGLTTNQITGIYNYEGLDSGQAVNELLFTDTKRMCRYNSVAESCDAIDAVDIFASSNYKWFTNFGVTGSVTQNTLYITDNDSTGVGAASPMRTYTFGAGTTGNFLPKYGAMASDVVRTCLMMFVMKNRLILLNTVEDSGAPLRKPQRARWCKAGDPSTAGDAWRQDITGNGGFVDCPTSDFIIGAAALQDFIIVFFSNSTWTLRPTPNPALPFRWDRINVFRACDSTYGVIGHDRYVVSFGRTGVVACDGIEVKRIDDKIQNFTTSQIDQTNFPTMYSGRDYALKRSWTLYSSAGADDSANNDAVLIRNEDDASWSTYDIEMSCIGSGSAPKDWTLNDFAGDYDWSFFEFDDETCLDFYTQAEGKMFLGGDYHGKIYLLEYGASDDTNADSDQPITMTATTVGLNPYKDKGVEAQLGYVDFYVGQGQQGNLTVTFFTDDSPQPVISQTVNLVPELNWIADVSGAALTNPCLITSYSHGLSTGNTVYIYGVEGMQEIIGGPYTITVVDGNSFTLDGIDATAFTAYTGEGIILETPVESNQVRLWKRAYCGAVGNLHQIRITNTGKNQPVSIHAMRTWFKPTGSRQLT